VSNTWHIRFHWIMSFFFKLLRSYGVWNPCLWSCFIALGITFFFVKNDLTIKLLSFWCWFWWRLMFVNFSYQLFWDWNFLVKM
jgi:hypothetical protein